MASPSAPSAADLLQQMTKYKSRTRTLLELQVGKSHLVEILLQIRRVDIPWFETNAATIWEEILDLLERSVIPRMCGDELERYHMARHPTQFPPETAVGQKNKTGRGNTTATGKKASMGKGGKRKRGGGGKDESSAAAATKKSHQKREEEMVPTKPDKDVYYAFGEEIQLAYRRTEIKQSDSLTLFFKEGETTATARSGSAATTSTPNNVVTAPNLHQFHKLSHRIHLWCSKIVDPLQKTNPDLQGVGFYRPELIPMASLFRQPPDGMEDDDDDDDDDD
jgi:hypothetical protein